ncbi:invasion associated locus B family protein [Devosia sp.]|uniref:invasion associated locus B family protein n=1 Tax=Devosia sp. TaxID=1871048 RepID=UPI001AC73D04|nr:invasion associated locus B family protein [Devosia sp.]MBN9334724.1 invasion associated locus B family protein [Devosia sp.]
MRNVVLSAALALALLSSPTFAQDAKPAALPGGAQSLNEEHGDWTVSCRIQDAAKLCVMSQTLADSRSGQPVLSVELATPAVDRAEGMLLLPFGLRLADGAVLKVDGKNIGANWPFLTCIATGCLVPVVFDASQISALRAGTDLVIGAANAGTGEAVELKLSLAGFSRAANRSVELSL